MDTNSKSQRQNSSAPENFVHSNLYDDVSKKSFKRIRISFCIFFRKNRSMLFCVPHQLSAQNFNFHVSSVHTITHVCMAMFQTQPVKLKTALNVTDRNNFIGNLFVVTASLPIIGNTIVCTKRLATAFTRRIKPTALLIQTFSASAIVISQRTSNVSKTITLI